MKFLRAAVLALTASTAFAGCYTDQPYGYGYAAYGPPPVATDPYSEERAGQVFVNGRYAWVNNAWSWRPGYYVGERPGYAYIQGYYNGGRWYDGRWEGNRPGFVHTGGYWDRAGGGYAWRPGTWERERAGQVYARGGWSGVGGARVYNRGGWRRR